MGVITSILIKILNNYNLCFLNIPTPITGKYPEEGSNVVLTSSCPDMWSRQIRGKVRQEKHQLIVLRPGPVQPTTY